MKNVWDACTFSDEIESGQMDLDKFAVELHTFLRNEADSVYQDPQQFLNSTYLTEPMGEILSDTIRRLNGLPAQPIDYLVTGFGAGKTHTLILLHHVISNPILGLEYVDNSGLHKKIGTVKIPNTRVVAIDCRQIKHNTLWGEIADRLGEYKKFEKYDQGLTPPPDIDEIRNLFRQPTLLMIDELLQYLLKSESHKVENTNMADMIIAFLADLNSAISSSKNSKLLYTISENKHLYIDQMRKVGVVDQSKEERLVAKIYNVQSRLARAIVPVSAHEIYHVVRTRLVKKIDPQARDETVSKYMKYYDSKSLLEHPDYRQNLIDSYPFHPLLLMEILYERVSTMPIFNRTRGILRLMSLVAHNIIKNRTTCKIICPGDVDLEDKSILDELTSRLGLSTYQPIIMSDCIKKAAKLDANGPFSIVTELSRTIYLYSLIGAVSKSGIHENKIKLAVGRPGLDLGLIDDGLKLIADEFWYINTTHGYLFDNKPNINKIIADYELEITPADIHKRIERTLKSIISPVAGKVDVCIWTSDIDECNILTLVVSKPNLQLNNDSIRQDADKILRFLPGGKSVRKRKNTLIFLYPDADLLNSIEKRARQVLAIEKTLHHATFKYDKEQTKIISSKKSSAEGNLEADCWRTYNILAYPHIDTTNSPIIRISRLPPVHTSQPNIVNAILKQLKDDGKLIVELGQDGLFIQKPITPSQILDNFRNDRTAKMIENQSSVLDAAIQAVQSKLFYSTDSLKKHKNKYVIDSPLAVDWGTYLIPPESAITQNLCTACGNPLKSEFTVCEHCANSKFSCAKCGSLTNLILVNANYYCNKCNPLKRTYTIYCDDIQSTIDRLQSLTIITVGMDIVYHIDSNVSNDFAKVVLSCDPKQLTGVTDLFKMFITKFQGTSTITVKSSVDISNELHTAGVKYEDVESQD